MDDVKMEEVQVEMEGLHLEEHEEEKEETEEVVEVEFDEPIDFAAYDQFSLEFVVQQRKLKKAEETNDIIRKDAPVSKPKTATDNIEAAINFKEDEEAIKKVEEINRAIAEQKLAESVADLPQDIENAKEEDSQSDDDSDNEERSKLKPAANSDPTKKKVITNWANTAKLPAKVYEKLRPHMAIEYPFELDEFQKQAVMRLERRENVFVAAHTSAGKTVVAEYGIALAMKNHSRAVYTSPIKALSNQKYRDFKDKFGIENVGIVTGDVSVNPQAQCLIMTTEIFRSMLYKGADTTRDIEFVIFDEVHYVNDAERGVVWEEVIIMLPPSITLIFLSATTPNAYDFSDWIGRTKQKEVHLISTNKRPVPLQHFLYYDNEMYKLMEGDRNYNPHAISQAKKRQMEKNAPKPKTAENAQFAAQRQQEKADRAAQIAGKNPAKQQQVLQQMNRGRGGGGGGRGGGGGGGRGGPGGGKSNPVGGGKGQWNALIKILQAGGREAAGGHGEIDFGVARSRNVLSKEARKQKQEQMEKYENLPKEIRDKISKKEYEATEFRGEEEEGISGDIGLLPVVVFSFSKKRCEELADFFKGQDFLTQREKAKVSALFIDVLGRLNPLDTELPQIHRLKDMLSRGIGVHHGGLLPILKETVELLFTESIVKVLFATETFAMGVNMPAKAVIFNGFRKHDGREFRDLLSGEYIQMAGRAGRRGLDNFGTVIITAWNELPNELTIKNLLTGRPTLLSSQFRLRYNMILNLVRVNNLSVQEMIKRSFTEFATQRQLSQSDIGTKLRKYQMYYQYLEQQSYYDETREVNPTTGSSNNSTISNDNNTVIAKLEIPELELERRQLLIDQLRLYVQLVQQCQELFSLQLQHIHSQNTSMAQNRRFDLNQFFGLGRIVFGRNADTGTAVWAMILNDPSTTAKLEAEAKAKAEAAKASSTTAAAVVQGKPAKKPLFEKSDFAKSRAALLGIAPAPSSTPTTASSTDPTPAAASGKDSGESSVNGMSVWVLCIVSEDDLPKWCEDQKDAIYRQDQINLASLTNRMYGQTDLSHYLIVKMALKDIAYVLSPAVGSIHSSAKTTTEYSLLDLLLPLIESTSKESLFQQKTMTFTNFYQEFKMNQISFVERQQQLLLLMEPLLVHHQRLHDHVSTIRTTATRTDDDEEEYSNPHYYQLSRLYDQVFHLQRIQQKIDLMQHWISDESLSLFPDFQQRINLLRALGYLDAQENVITKKGRVCCELNTCDELLGTEILFHNLLEPLNPPEAVAMLSALIFQEKNDVEETLTSRMETARQEVLQLLTYINELQIMEGIDSIDLDNHFVSQVSNKPLINFGLCAVVYQWARGIPFKEITQMTEFQEGSIVRTITRLDELCRDIQNAARVMGNQSLYYKMEAASQCIKRDIVFAASLYLV